MQSPAWLSGVQVGGSSDSRSPAPASTASRSQCSGGALGTSATPESSHPGASGS